MFFEAQQSSDLRTVQFESDPAAIEVAWSAGESWKEAEIAFAKTLAVLEDKRAYREFGCVSLAQWTQRLGVAPEETRRLLAIGRAIAAQPSVEERVREKALTASAAAAVAPLLVAEKEAKGHTLFFSGWTDRAEGVPLTRLRRDVREEMAKRRSGESIVRVELHVTETAREDLERARVVASRKEARFLTRDETVGVALAHYLDSFDPLRETEGTRRVGPTADRPQDRYVPMSVRRAIRRRARDCCEFPGCTENIDLEFAHRTPHREGSGREVGDLFLLCWLHHSMVDKGMSRVVGSAVNPSWVDGFGIVTTRDSVGGREPRSEAEHEAVRAQLAKSGRPSCWSNVTLERATTGEQAAAEPALTLATVLTGVAAGGESDSAGPGRESLAASAAAPRPPPD